MVVAAVAVALLVALAALAPRPAAARAARSHAAGTHLPPRFFGMNVDGPLLDPGAPIDAEFARIRRSHLRYVRLYFPWWYMQPRRPASRRRRVLDGDINVTYADRFVLAAARAGLRVLPIIGQATPAWVSLDPFNQSAPPRDPSAYGAFAGALVRRYGPRGYIWGQVRGLRPQPIRTWQVWNEPDLKPYWDVTPWAPSYARLLRAGSRALHRADPGAQVVAGGLTNRSWEDLAALYDAGARRSFDAVAIHPYTATVPGVVELVRRARRVMRANGDARKPVLITELGWPATVGAPEPRFAISTTPKGQEQRLVGSVRRLTRLRRTLRIASICVYTWLSEDTGELGSFRYAGLRGMTPRGPVSRPAEAALRGLLRRLSR